MISDYTVIYESNGGTRREFYVKATSIAHATISARELLPQCVEIVRVFHNPNWT